MSEKPPDVTYFVRAMEPEAIAWTDCPPQEVERQKERGMTKVDAEAHAIHRRVYGSDE